MSHFHSFPTVAINQKCPTELLTEGQLAERWGLSVKTLQSWRQKRKGPEYLKLGRAVRYSLTIVESFEQTMRTRSTYERV